MTQRLHYGLLLFSVVLLSGWGLLSCHRTPEKKSSEVLEFPGWVIVVHGGAGYMDPETMAPEKENLYRKDLEAALYAGGKILENGGSALDAVEAAIKILEDSPLFNAGRGSVFNTDGVIEMDASVMDGNTGKAGAVAGVTTIRNPISAARKVMDNTPHVLLIGNGAERFAREQGLEIADPSYFFTEEAWKEHQQGLARMRQKSGETVGCVARDIHGNLAAGTSTGGRTNKLPGRVGDVPIIGAGTFADNNTCAVSCTGHGEFFIRTVVAYDMAARMKYLGQPIEQAAEYIINVQLRKMGAGGGLIALDHQGNLTMSFNTTSMPRGYLKSGSQPVTLIFENR